MRNSAKITIRVALLIAALCAGADGLTVSRAEDDLGIRAPEGFEVSLYADDDLATNIYSLTVDSLGRVVAAGPDYVRILLDEDGDGKAEKSRQFSDVPKTGAQGLFFDGRDLICTGDAGVLRFLDKNGDDRADGPPEVLLTIKAGGEHHVHAVQKGPDGWWYIIAGNDSGVDETYASLPSSPIKKPRAGVLLRIKPDFSGTEILAHGLRNAYDFDFSESGDIFTYDSDDERSVSLPWYRPTRVFHLMPGSDAGWVSRSWRHPNYYLDMPPVLAELGRGSPTGVVCYRHTQFPEPYRGAIFVLDWTFGRVIALPLEPDGSIWKSEPIEFLRGVGGFGFAPTDAAVGPDGSLFVSVGGRGTRGGVYRITFGAEKRSPKLPPKGKGSEELLSCLAAQQPLSSWSRAAWAPIAKKLGREAFLKAALDESLPSEARARAIEVCVEMFGGLDGETLATVRGEPRAVRARAAWSLGYAQTRERLSKEDLDRLTYDYVMHAHPFVRRAALEALIYAHGDSDREPLFDKSSKCREAVILRLADNDGRVRMAAARVLARGDCDDLERLSARSGAPNSDSTLPLYATLVLALADEGKRLSAFQRAAEICNEATDMLLAPPSPNRDNEELARRAAEMRLLSLLVMVHALGQSQSDAHRAPVFDGYATQPPPAEARVPLPGAFPDWGLDSPKALAVMERELFRLAAMIGAPDPVWLAKVLDRITPDSRVQEDIHHLIVAARLPAPRTKDQSKHIAVALLSLDAKIMRFGLHIDNDWAPRVGELYQELSRLDPRLPGEIVRHEDFGRLPGHLLFVESLPPELQREAATLIVKRIAETKDYRWTPQLVFFLGRLEDDGYQWLIREQYENFSLRSAVLQVLASHPAEMDREKFVTGLESSSHETLSACLVALSRLPASRVGAEQIALVKLLRTLGYNDAEQPLREAAIKLLNRNLSEDFGFETGKDGQKPQTAVIQRWTDHVTKLYPDEARLLNGNAEDAAALKQLLDQVDWTAGDASRGKELFSKRSCANCHGGGGALGPDLAGAAKRFSRNDLFTAIALPNRDVSPRYQTTYIQTKDGRQISGLVIYESVDGVILRDADNRTHRIEGAEIELQTVVPKSLMPTGLLKDLAPRDLADLEAFLRTH